MPKEAAMARQFGQALAVLVVLGVSAGFLHAGPTPAQKCAVAKSKAAGKKFDAKLKCNQKAILKGQAVEPNCLMAAESKFNTAITKAEAKGGCVATGDANAIEGVVEACVSTVVNVTRAVACQTANMTCHCGNVTTGSDLLCGDNSATDCTTLRAAANQDCAINGESPTSCDATPCTDACTGQICG